MLGYTFMTLEILDRSKRFPIEEADGMKVMCVYLEQMGIIGQLI